MTNKTEVSQSWLTLVVTNPRAALNWVLGFFIVILGYVVMNLYTTKNELYIKVVEIQAKSNEDKIELINTYILRQQEMNERYTKKIEDLYGKINEINKSIR